MKSKHVIISCIISELACQIEILVSWWKHTTTLISLSDRDILRPELRVVVDQAQTI